jgi:MFS superfamily sulfate permease-like transporter
MIILGGLLLILALFFSHSVDALFQLFPPAVLGVVLFITGVQLAAGGSVLPHTRGERLVTLVCAALCIWNVALGFLIGIGLHHLNKRGLLRM